MTGSRTKQQSTVSGCKHSRGQNSGDANSAIRSDWLWDYRYGTLSIKFKFTCHKKFIVSMYYRL